MKEATDQPFWLQLQSKHALSNETGTICSGGVLKMQISSRKSSISYTWIQGLFILWLAGLVFFMSFQCNLNI